MRPSGYEVVCNTITPFGPDGGLDLDAFRSHLDRLAVAGISVNLGVAGTGEAYYLSDDELAAVYATGVEVCGGRVGTYGVVRESRSAREVLDLAALAVEAGVDHVHVYGLDMGHKTDPSPAAHEAYFRAVLDRLDHRVVIGNVAPTAMIVGLCRDYEQVVGVNVGNMVDTSAVTTSLAAFLRFRDEIRAVSPEIRIYSSHVSHVIAERLLGADGWYCAEANVAPALCRSFADELGAGRYEEAAALFEHLRRLADAIRNAGSADGPRVERGNIVPGTKAALRVLGLDSGVARPPYQPLPDDALARLGRTLDALGVPELTPA
jgi:4-hydroxy-tetrahydrodipicolinate synthase